MKICYVKWLVLVLLIVGWATSLAAQEAELTPQASGRSHYEGCILLGQDNPQDAFDLGMRWRDQGGGLPAQHCVALALAGLGLYEQAAEQLDLVANNLRTGKGLNFAQMVSRGDRKVLADIYLQSGNAWLLANRPIMAYDAFSQGLLETDIVSQQALELYIDRARASGLSGDYQPALNDLGKASEIAPERVDIFVYIATAHRALENFDAATQALESALTNFPDNPDALLERGNLRFAMGDIDAARLDWVRLISIHPDNYVSDVARTNIEKLDALEDEVIATPQ